MRLRLLLAGLSLAALWPPAIGAARADDAPGAPISTATRQNAFTIPFRIEPPQTPAAAPVEVQLHVSTDQGVNWTLATSVRPERGSFVFRAPHDGEYWYSIRTVDAQGVVRPDGPLAPQLKVTVDTVAPRLDLAVSRGAAGEIVARWQAVDPHLKPESFKLEYQAASTGPWERVAVEAPPSAMRHTVSGEATWWPSGATGPIVVRAEITDLSGNPAVSQAVVKPGDLAPPPNVAQAGAPPPSTTTAAPPADGWRANEPPAGETAWPPDRAMPNSLGSGTASASSGQQAAPVDTPDEGGAPAGFTPDTSGQRAPVQTVSSSRTPRPGSALDFSLLPAAVRPRMVNSTTFEIEYELESVGPSGVSRVALWGTRDGGRTWSDFAIDSDNRSPMPVTVNGEGIYGFRILVQSGSGYGGRPPAEGDLPDVWIGVDVTRPTCRLTGTEVAPDASEVAIHWEAADDVLDPRPVTLLFSPSRSGPWTPIASGLENTGSYRWKLDPRVPERIVIRLEVRDEAGNVGVCDTADVISLDRHRPAGKIRGVRPITK